MHRRPARALLKAFPGAAFLAAHTWPELIHGDKPVVCLSFDCDTEEDTECLPSLLKQLEKSNVPASFAVIGELVEANAEPYKLLEPGGHEVLNHGYGRHTQQRPDGTFFSSRFYHQLSEKEIRHDITQNHTIAQNLLDLTMQGFRTPHFSTFQQPEHRTFLYQVLADLAYTYSSSVTSIYQKTSRTSCQGELWELPLTGCWDDLRSPFDSWGLIAAPDRHYNDDDFYRLFRLMFDATLDAPDPVFLNLYFDPAHVVNFSPFTALLQDLSASHGQVDILLYRNLVTQLT